MVSTHQQPVDSSTTGRIAPVNNVMPIVITSNKSGRDEFKFVCDDYIDGGTTAATFPPYSGTLISRAFLSPEPGNASSAAVHDPHRVYSSYVTFDQSHSYLGVANVFSIRRYLVSFGETMTPYVHISTLLQYILTGDVMMTTVLPHNLQVGDYVNISLFDTTPAPTYVGTWRVKQVIGSSIVRLDLAYTADVTGGDVGIATEYWGFNDTFFYSDVTGAFVGLSSDTSTVCATASSNKHYMQVGDEIVVTVDLANTIPINSNPQYSGRWRVMQVIDDYNIITNIPWDVSTSCQPGYVHDIRNRIYPNQGVSVNYSFIMNAVFEETDYSYLRPGDVMQTYYPSVTHTDALLLTNNPDREFFTKIEDHGTIGTIFSDYVDGGSIIRIAAYWDRAYVETFNENNTSLGFGVILNPHSTSTAGPLRLDIPIYPWNLNNATASFWADATARPTFINTNVAYYKMILFRNAGLIQTSQEYTFNVEHPKCLYPTFRLAWVNDLGAWDYFNFNLNSKQTINIERSTYRKKRGTLTGIVFDAANTDRGLSTFDTKALNTYSIISDWITENQASWLGELLRSQQVFWWKDATVGFVPIVITDDKYSPGVKRTNKNIQIAISFVEAWDYNNNRN